MSKSIEISSDLKIRLEEVLHGISQLDTPDLEKFLAEVGQLLAKRKVKTLPKGEAELLLKINQALLSTQEQERYQILYKKLQREEISEEEHQILLELIRLREERGVERMRCLIELAQVRKLPLQDLMKELEIHSLSDAA